MPFERLDAILEVWDREIVATIVEETNYYAFRVIAKLEKRNVLSKNFDIWVETTIEEMYKYLAILMFMKFWTT